MGTWGRIACALLGALCVPASAEILILSEAKAGALSDQIWCYYTEDGNPGQSIYGTVSLAVVAPQKPLLTKILGRELPIADQQSACPKTVNR